MVFLVPTLLFAETTSSTTFKFTGAWDFKKGIEAKLDTAYQIKMPLLVGDGPLFSGNNLKLKTGLGISPIAVTASFDAVLTPIAIAEVSLGGAVGTGWDLALGSMQMHGLLNSAGGSIGAPLFPDPVGGAYYEVNGGLALQFDTGAIFEGDWKSVVLRTYHELNYKGYSGAVANQAWEYETAGAYVNGLNYKGEYIIGYQMPLMVNLVGLQLETYLFDLLGEKRGTFLDLSVIINTQFTSHFSLLTAVQFTNYYRPALDPPTREALKRSEPGFKRVALIFTYAL